MDSIRLAGVNKEGEDKPSMTADNKLIEQWVDGVMVRLECVGLSYSRESMTTLVRAMLLEGKLPLLQREIDKCNPS